MARTISFLLDEHVDPAIAAGLCLHRVDVTTTRDAGLLRAHDTEHVAYALQSGRVIFTQDEDFLRLHSAGIEHCGIVFSAQQTRSIGQIIAGLLLIWEVYEPEEMVKRVEFL
jgi:predicted nuclease of predicted toxin-antitoxin system